MSCDHQPRTSTTAANTSAGDRCTSTPGRSCDPLSPGRSLAHLLEPGGRQAVGGGSVRVVGREVTYRLTRLLDSQDSAEALEELHLSLAREPRVSLGVDLAEVGGGR